MDQRNDVDKDQAKERPEIIEKTTFINSPLSDDDLKCPLATKINSYPSRIRANSISDSRIRTISLNEEFKKLYLHLQKIRVSHE